MRRSDVHTPRRMISGSGDPGLYFSEVDTFQRPVDFENEALGRYEAPFAEHKKASLSPVPEADKS